MERGCPNKNIASSAHSHVKWTLTIHSSIWSSECNHINIVFDTVIERSLIMFSSSVQTLINVFDIDVLVFTFVSFLRRLESELHFFHITHFTDCKCRVQYGVRILGQNHTSGKVVSYNTQQVHPKVQPVVATYTHPSCVQSHV